MAKTIIPQTVLNTDALDQVIFDQVAEAQKIQDLMQTDVAAAAVQDVFGSLYKLNPQVRPEAQGAQKQIIQNMMQMPEYKELAQQTRLDDIASAFGTLQLSESVLEQVEQVQKKMDQEKKSAEEVMEGMSDAEKAGMRQALRRSMEEAQEKADEVQGLFRAWGTQPGELQQLPFEKKFALAEQLQNAGKLRRISDLIGRFRNIVNSMDATRWTHGHDEIVSITLGQDIGRLLPSEYAKLDHTPELFFKDYVERNLLQYDLKGVEPQGKGPIICCLDVSGSMSGEPEEWAKAVCLTLIHLAETQKRAFGLVTFEGRVVDAKFWPAGKRISLEEKVWIASMQSNGGGTDYMKALMQAFEFRDQEAQLKPADIVFITDGEYRFTEGDLAEVHQQKKLKDMRCFGIGVGIYNPQGLEQSLTQFCDQIGVVTRTGDIETVQRVVRTAAGELIGSSESTASAIMNR